MYVFRNLIVHFRISLVFLLYTISDSSFFFSFLIYAEIAETVTRTPLLFNSLINFFCHFPCFFWVGIIISLSHHIDSY